MPSNTEVFFISLCSLGKATEIQKEIEGSHAFLEVNLVTIILKSFKILQTISKEPHNENAASIRRICKRSNQPKI